MAIYHDAYFFSASDFASFLGEHNKAGLEAKVLEYMEDEFVLKLCDNYGSWDYQGVKTTLDDYKANETARVKFMFFIILYKYLSRFSNHPEGLGYAWRVLLDESLISENERKILVYGNEFNLFFDTWKIKKLDTWKALGREIAPPSTSSHLGFLTKEDMLRVQQALLETKAKLGADKKELDFAISKSLRMLQSAVENNLGLCVILSG